MSNSSLKAFLWSFLEQGGSKVVSLVVQIVLARILSPEAFGVLAILLVVTNVADAIAQSGLGSAIIQRKTSDEVTYSTAFWLSMGIAAALFCCILVVSPAIESFYAMPDLGGYLNVLALVVFFNSANSIQRSILQKQMDFKSLFWTSTLAAIASGVIGAGGAFAGWGVWALVAQTISQSAATCIVMAARVPWRPRLAFSKSEAGELLSYGWKIAFTSILNVFYTGISDLVVGRACSAEALGYYSQGRKYPMAVISMATNAIQNVMFPALAKRQESRKAFANATRRALVTGTFVIAPLALYCASAAEPIVALLLTEKWLPCVPIFQMVCVSHSVMMLTMANLRAYMALGESGLYLKLQVFKVVIGGVAICGTAILTGDIYLTALTTCISTLFNTVVVDPACAKWVYGYSAVRQMKDIGPSILLAAVAALVGYAPTFVVGNYIARLLLQTLAFWLVYLIGARVLRLQGLSDCVSIAQSLIPNRKAEKTK
ncbi:lipopolysaccharide biosynthesis protein [Collinsella tanakaei]|nr:lipopolysaccharide biosynthesis protein [Collinsella tanakaei]